MNLAGEMLRVALPRFAKPAPLQLRLTPAGAAALAGEAPTEEAAPAALKAADRLILLHLQRLGRPCGVTSLVQGTEERRGPLLARLRRLRTMGLVARHEARRRPRLDWVVQRAAAADPARLGARQGRARRLWEALPATGSVCLSDLRQALPWAQSQLQILLKARLVVAQEIPYGGLPAPSTAVATPPQPTPEQAAAVILRGIEQNKARILIGFDAKLIDWVTRLLPTRYGPILLPGIAQTFAPKEAQALTPNPAPEQR